ncbi:hypothetical protein OCH239_06905 [Roseivivax halodurans JCM 10272]|uniref:Enterobactin synthase component D n=1 Tax=Roseivivax halodurans JCM 10272 TaxID=1449350 RepID=X7EFA3_9RHOB|nr:4'-phosphopantetheinyl transferase superfamily protein [Roseivivax halodurans]ETX13793.1 hypothetical protein OCH239_06905 [Roseivivax halodurans JCM 10272]
MARDLSRTELPLSVRGGFLRGLARIEASDPTLSLVLAEVDPDRFEDAEFSAHGFAHHGRLDRAVTRRRAGWLSGRIAARAACAEIGLELVELSADEEGVPLWPSGVSGSISHTDGLASALVACGARRLGVDVEHVPDGPRLAALRSATLSAPERHRLAEPWQATLGFSAKECLYKALYPELRSFFGFDAAEVTELGGDTAILTLTVELSADLRSGRAFRVNFRRSGDTVLTWLCADP